MKLIEKKCPNCGGSLEFSETDKSCKCEYCHRAFEIERDEKLDVSDIAEQFNLNELKTPLKVFAIFPIVVFVIIFIITLVIFGVIAHSMFSSSKASKAEIVEKETLLTDVTKLDNVQLEEINEEAKGIAYQTAQGRNDTTYSYLSSESLRLQKVYIAYKDGSNYVISIYKSAFHNYFNQKDNQVIYTPVVFENVHENLDLHNGKNPAPEYYFNSEKSSYVYAYKTMEEAYNAVVKPLEDEGYKITEK